MFYENKYANDGFNMIYWDFFDKAVAKTKKIEGNEESAGEFNKGNKKLPTSG